MTVWIKQGVVGDLQPVARKGLGRLAVLFENLYITSIRDGNHSPGSLHYDGLAFDIRYGNASKEKMQAVLGTGWDVVFESNHIHCEYDPKE